MKPTLASLFPNASASTVAANPHLVAANGGSGKQNESGTILKPRRGKRGVMNKTEQAYALILEAMKRKGEILDYWFEGITLRWNGVQYTPDFTVIRKTGQLGFIEIKGAFTGGKLERAVERFRHARTFWTYFDFELHKKTKDGWKRIY